MSQSFSPRTMVILLIVAVCAATGFGVLSVYAPELREPRSSTTVLSPSAVGFSGLADLLRDEGQHVFFNRDVPRSDSQIGDAFPGAGQPLIIVTPDFTTSAETLKRFEHQGATLLFIAPKWRVAPDPEHPGFVIRQDLNSSIILPEASLPGIKALRRSKGLVAGQSVQGDLLADHPLTLPAVAQFQTAEVSAKQALLSTPDGRGFLFAVDDGVFVMSEPDLLNNHGLKTLAGARFASLLIDRLRGPSADKRGVVVFDITLAGRQKARNLFKWLLEPPFSPATGLLALALVILGWTTLPKFIPPRQEGRAIPLGKAALVDNAAALIRLAHREPKMAARYAALIRRQAAQGLGLAPETAPEAVDAHLDRIGDPTGASRPFSDRVRAALGAKDLGELMQTTRDLYDWRASALKSENRG